MFPPLAITKCLLHTGHKSQVNPPPSPCSARVPPPPPHCVVCRWLYSHVWGCYERPWPAVTGLCGKFTFVTMWASFYLMSSQRDDWYRHPLPYTLHPASGRSWQFTLVFDKTLILIWTWWPPSCKDLLSPPQLCFSADNKLKQTHSAQFDFQPSQHNWKINVKLTRRC